MRTNIDAQPIGKSPIILAADGSDYDELINLWEESVVATHGFLSPSEIQDYKLLIYDYYFDAQNLYYIRDEYQIHGFIGLNGNFIQMLFIRPMFIGQGIGKALIHFAIDKHGANNVDVNEQNIPAVNFYQHLGFEVTERFDKDAAGKPHPILSMKLPQIIN